MEKPIHVEVSNKVREEGLLAREPDPATEVWNLKHLLGSEG